MQRTNAVLPSTKGSLVANVVRSSGQRIASLASETQEYSSLDSNHSTEELSVQETAPDVFREPEEDEDPPSRASTDSEQL